MADNRPTGDPRREGPREDGEDPVEFSMEIADDRTEIVVSGDRDTAVVVRSDSGEKIYLPPEDFDRPPEDRRTAYDSPYRPRSGAEDSPYRTHPDATSVTGMEPTATGYIVVHPEPVTDVRFLR
ncbi:MAG: hypothetical protein BRD23_09900 [Halobacteriales archaeon SW_9_67_25]|jgi:hypothetical protein|nr:MAG: hypothetical protein BRD23_09900 [Halobacteriales archaeon SW_9_67_25]